MEQLFLNKDLSLLAKEKGFDEPCFGYYINDAGLHVGYRFNNPEHNTNSIGATRYKDEDFVFAPLYQQIIDWFREKHNISIHVHPEVDIEDLSFTMSGKWNFITQKIVAKQEWSSIQRDKRPKADFDFYKVMNNAIEEAFKLLP